MRNDTYQSSYTPQMKRVPSEPYHTIQFSSESHERSGSSYSVYSLLPMSPVARMTSAL